VVVQELIDRFGNRKKGWPKKLLKSLEERNAVLLAAIQERVCFVPKVRSWGRAPPGWRGARVSGARASHAPAACGLLSKNAPGYARLALRSICSLVTPASVV
jgi:hypothetical protein